MPKKKSLQAALANQQSKFKEQTHLAQAVKLAQKKKDKATTAAKKNKKNIHVTIPFRPTDKILLIGEGNFSFAYSLVVHPPSPDLHHLPPQNITATAYDTEEECLEKYPDAEEKIQVLRAKGVQVFFGIDATKLEKHTVLKGRKWDRVVWNFPHAGRGIADQDRNILSNQLMILGFLRSVADFLIKGPVPSIHSAKRNQTSDDGDGDDEDDEEEAASASEVASSRGTVIITLRNVPPYTTWDVPKLAKKPPPPAMSGAKQPNPHYILLRSFVFRRQVWKGYEHRMTKGERGKAGKGGEERSWEFCLKDLG